jgi:hypothetical protein
MTKKEKCNYIAEHYGKDKTLAEISAETGYCTDNIMAVARKLRAEGFNIPHYRNVAPIGTVNQRQLKGYTYNFIKTEKGWKQIKKEPDEHIKPTPKPRINVKIKKAKPPTEPRKPDYQKQGTVKIKQDDLVNNHWVKTDNKTYVLKPRT